MIVQQDDPPRVAARVSEPEVEFRPEFGALKRTRRVQIIELPSETLLRPNETIIRDSQTGVGGCMVAPRLLLVYGLKIDDALSRRWTDLDVVSISIASC